MSYEVLVKDLREKSSNRIREVWLEVETKAEDLRSLKRKELAKRQSEMLGQSKETRRKITAPIIQKAQRSALVMEDDFMLKLSERLYTLAFDKLVQLRRQNYESVFAELVGEVPDIVWEKIQVNPLDKELAISAFPDAEIKADPSITGGYIASGEGGAYRVVNTLERRLEKGWPVILPLILKEIIEAQNVESAA